MAKKTTLEDLVAMMEKNFSAVADDLAHMATKKDIEKLDARVEKLGAHLDRTNQRIVSPDENVAGLKILIQALQTTLDNEALVRADQKLPERISAVETHLGIKSPSWETNSSVRKPLSQAIAL